MNRNLRQQWQINKYLWMAVAFALAYIPVASGRGLLTIPLWGAWTLFAAAVVNVALRSWFGYRTANQKETPRVRRDPLSWTFTFVDIAIISLAIGVTKGLQSDLWLLYFITMISESLYASPRQTRLIALIVAGAYALSTFPVQWFGSRLSPLDFYTVLATRLFFLISIGAFARRISFNTTVRSEELAFLREQQAAGEERSRIAREIHDSLGHSLTTIILRLELAAKLVRKNPSEAETLLSDEILTLRAAWNAGRDLAFHLRPWELELSQNGGLPETLRRHISRFAERTGAIIEFEADEDAAGWNLRPEAAFGLTRVAQEALTNAARHGRAAKIIVELRRETLKTICLTVRDNGAGFDTENFSEGVGLAAMRERMEKIGGTFQIESAPDNGTAVFARLPV